MQNVEGTAGKPEQIHSVCRTWKTHRPGRAFCVKRYGRSSRIFAVFAQNLLRLLAGDLGKMIETLAECSDPGGGRPQFNDEVLNFGFRHQGLNCIPAFPTGPCIKAEKLATLKEAFTKKDTIPQESGGETRTLFLTLE